MSQTSAVPFESPSLTADARDEIIIAVERKIHECSESYQWNPNKWSQERVDATLSSCSDDCLIALRDFLMVEAEGFFERERLNDFVFTLAQKDNEADGTLVHEQVTYIPFMNSNSMIAKMGIIKGLHEYKQLPAIDNYAKVDAETRDRIATLVSAIDTIHAKHMVNQVLNLIGGKKEDQTTPLINCDDDGRITLSDHALVSLLWELPEAASEVSDIICNNGITDGNLIREMVESDAKSIRNGML